MDGTLSGKKALETHLDNEFVFLAQFIRLYKERVSDIDQSKCFAWLQKLLSPTRDGTTRRVRNTYLAELLLHMQSGVLCGPFAKKPGRGALSLTELQTNTNFELGEPEWLNTVINAPVPGDEGVDERTYIATQVHPDGQSAYAYMAVSTTDHDHWIDPMTGDNESAVNVTPPKSHVPPTSCNSCSSVNPIPEDIKLPCTDELPGRCRRQPTGRPSERPIDDIGSIHCPDEDNPLIHFYDELLALVDCVQRSGCCSDDTYVTQLLRRMKEQTTDPALLDMSAEQLHSELLHRLKAKLLTRKEQAKKMKAAVSPLEEVDSEDTATNECATDLDLSLDEELWESAARRELSPTNMTLLGSAYPPALVSRFVNGLIRERCSLIARMRAEHEVLVTSMKNDIQKDIEESLDRFRQARALWVLLLRANEELQHIRRYELTNAAEAEKNRGIRETVREIRDAMVALDEEGRRGANLANQLVSEHQDLYATEREAERHAQRLLAHNDALRLSLQAAKAHEASQVRKIHQLQHELTLSPQTKT